MATNGKVNIAFENAQHLEAIIKDGRLYISIALEPEGTESATGKTFVIATSRGNQATSALARNRPVTIGVNAYVKK